MNMGHLTEDLGRIRQICGMDCSATLGQYEAIDIAASFAISLSNGRITSDAEVKELVRQSHNTRNFLARCRKPVVDVPVWEDIELTLNDLENRKVPPARHCYIQSDPPVSTVPKVAEVEEHFKSLAKGIRWELWTREDLDAHQKKRLANTPGAKAIMRFVNTYGCDKVRQKTSGVGGASYLEKLVMTSSTSEELVARIESGIRWGSEDEA